MFGSACELLCLDSPSIRIVVLFSTMLLIEFHSCFGQWKRWKCVFTEGFTGLIGVLNKTVLMVFYRFWISPHSRYSMERALSPPKRWGFLAGFLKAGYHISNFESIKWNWLSRHLRCTFFSKFHSVDFSSVYAQSSTSLVSVEGADFVTETFCRSLPVGHLRHHLSWRCLWFCRSIYVNFDNNDIRRYSFRFS